MSAPSAPRAFPLALAAALVALVGALAVRLLASEPFRPGVAPHATDPEGLVEGWASPEGAAQGFQLTPLYPEPERQVFEAASLRAELALAEGEPFRLVRASGADSASSAGARAAVLDEHGLALAPIDPDTRRDGAADPVRALLSTPLGVARAEAREWILWGRAPHGDARVELDGTLVAALEPRKLRRADLELPLAHVPRAGLPGKTAGSAASLSERNANSSEQR